MCDGTACDTFLSSFAAVLRQSNIPRLHVLLISSLQCNLHAVTLFSFGRKFSKFTLRVFLVLPGTSKSVSSPAFVPAEITAPDNTRRIHLRKVVKSRSGSILDFGIGTKQFVYFGFYDGDE